MVKLCTVCKSEKQISDFNKNKSKKDGYNNICRECSNQSSREYYNSNLIKHKAAVLKKNNEVRRSNRISLIAYKKAHPCPYCGESEPVCLDLHHLEGNDKERNISEAVSRGWSWDRIQSELNKCICICSNCHRKIHTGLLEA